ncbi:hypothetical protein J2T21_002557 [Paeniglutamicibacter psychrophenolicus]|nr:hypothetical protein [Paeniglutamicibacter psychrophenolicus]
MSWWRARRPCPALHGAGPTRQPSLRSGPTPAFSVARTPSPPQAVLPTAERHWMHRRRGAITWRDHDRPPGPRMCRLQRARVKAQSTTTSPEFDYHLPGELTTRSPEQHYHQTLFGRQLISGQMSAKRQPLGSGSRLPTCGPRQQQVRTVPAGCFERQPTILSGPASPADSRIPASLVPDGPGLSVPGSAPSWLVCAMMPGAAGGGPCPQSAVASMTKSTYFVRGQDLGRSTCWSPNGLPGIQRWPRPS